MRDLRWRFLKGNVLVVGQVVATAQDARGPAGHHDDALAGDQGRVWQVECAVDSIEVAVSVQYVLQITRRTFSDGQCVQERRIHCWGGAATSGILMVFLTTIRSCRECQHLFPAHLGAHAPTALSLRLE